MAAEAVDAVLVVCFRWLADTVDRRYLYAIDCTDLPEDVAAAAAIVGMSVQALYGAEDWRARRTAAVTRGLSVVVARPDRK